ncbi:unnamed protein product [Somion occarium]|uniref:Peroxin domain-containing protein n=1 Tax=Somion occarium TaxID=3059160 RepID=A0ABP1CJC3_9APHY
MSRDSESMQKSNPALQPPPVHPALRSAPASNTSPRVLPPKPPPRPPPRPSPSVQPTHDDRVVQSEPGLPVYMPGSVDAFEPAKVDPPTEASSILDDLHEEDLSEVELRELYDSEEIDHFLHLFHTYVSEVKVSGQAGSEASLPQSDGIIELQEVKTDDVPSSDADSVTMPPVAPIPELTLSEWFASLLKMLPPQQQQFPSFSVKRLRMTMERTYLALGPLYLSVFGRLARLATWQEYNTSLVCCVLYWILWYHGLLISGTCARILFSLIRRRYLPYPTLAELRQHRSQVDRAEQFSVGLSMRLAASPSFGVTDAWQLFREFRSRKRTKGKDMPVPVSTLEIVAESPDVEDGVPIVSEETIGITSNMTPDEIAMAQKALFIVIQIADLHERVKNIFLWRRPSASMTFAFALIGVIFVTALPAKYLVKMLGLAIGLLYWHVIPVIAAIPPLDRLRFPAPLKRVPTDAEYAMELISQRVASGLDVKPRRRKAWRSDSSNFSSPDFDQPSVQGSPRMDKWTGHVTTARDYVSNVKDTFKSGQWKDPGRWHVFNPLSTSAALPERGLQRKVDTRTFPAQHGKSTGLITLTPSTLIFTSAISLTPKLTIDLKQIVGVQKSGLVSGLHLRWSCVDDEGRVEEKDEKFAWVGGRDELFTRLVGSQSGRWVIG